MPSKSNRKRSTMENDVRAVADDGPQPADTAPVSDRAADAPALPPTAPDTAATRGVWAALIAQPGSAAATLADAAGISRPTAAKALAALEKAGLATRTEGGREGSKRLPDRWQPVLSSETGASHDVAPEAAVPEASDHETTDEGKPAGHPQRDMRESVDGMEDTAVAPAGDTAPAPTETTTDTGKARLGSGQLRDMVLTVLRDHPDQDFSPSAMGKLLTRSSGAISNACDRLQADGAVVRTSDKPRKFRIAAAKS